MIGTMISGGPLIMGWALTMTGAGIGELNNLAMKNAWKAQKTSGSTKPLKTVKRERKVKKGEAKEKGKENLRAKTNHRRDIPAGHAEAPIITSVIAIRTPIDGGKIEETKNPRAQI